MGKLLVFLVFGFILAPCAARLSIALQSSDWFDSGFFIVVLSILSYVPIFLIDLIWSIWSRKRGEKRDGKIYAKFKNKR